MHLVVYDADHHIVTAFDERFHRRIPHAAGDQAVHTAWGAAALDMSEYTDPRIGRGDAFLDDRGDVFRTPVAFGHDDDVHELFAPFFFQQAVHELLDIRFAFGDQDVLRARSDAAVERDITGVPAHHFDDEETIVGVRGVPDLIDGFYGGIHGRIETDGKIGTRNIFIDGAGKADTGDIELFAEFMGAPEGTVAADDHQAIDTQFFEVGVGLFPAFVFKEFLTPCSFEYCSAALDDIGDAAAVHRYDIVFDHSAITPHDPKYLQSIINTGTNNGTDGCIHSRSITAGSEYANFSDFVFHFGSLFL